MDNIGHDERRRTQGSVLTVTLEPSLTRVARYSPLPLVFFTAARGVTATVHPDPEQRCQIEPFHYCLKSPDPLSA